MSEPIQLPGQGHEGRMWHQLLDLRERRADGWTIVGALMVSLHAAAARLVMPRATKDIDTVVEVRGVIGEPQRFARDLVALGWDIRQADIQAEGAGHRFTKAGLTFDVLVPEGLGERVDLTTLAPLFAVPIAGATQALRRTTPMAVQCAGRAGELPCPDVLGAIVLKSCAATAEENDPDKRPQRHIDDLAVLYATVSDPASCRDAADTKDRRRIRRAGEPNWAVLRDERVADARAARDIILS